MAIPGLLMGPASARKGKRERGGRLPGVPRCLSAHSPGGSLRDFAGAWPCAPPSGPFPRAGTWAGAGGRASSCPRVSLAVKPVTSVCHSALCSASSGGTKQ